VNWESGIAGKNKDVWIFEPYSQFGRISVVTPKLRHYVVFDLTDEWLGYIKKIIESYDDSHILPAIVVGGGLGAILAEKDRAGTAVAGAIIALALTNKTHAGINGDGVLCPHCHSVYSVHLPKGIDTFRCPVCNTNLKIQGNP
jgi:hypothetical protein